MDLQTQHAIVITDADRIELDLGREFDLTMQEVRDVATQIYRGFAGVSGLHPKGFNGTNAWAEGTAHLRSILIPKGWVPDDPSNQPRIVAPSHKLCLTVSSGTPDTGVPHRTPQTRNDKGAQTASSVQYNARQGTLFPMGSSNVVALPTTDGQALWFLLYYIDLDAREVRVELSRPNAMSETDRVSGWSVRYVIPPVPLLPELVDNNLFESPDIDFDVAPKQL
ncbi:hypothetical protein ACCQ21_12225 [Xanthomonas axonopodis pv. desmodiigangetici]|uniref:hypothetical protein n=1 Tax=Xanthomonas axonopodis TaxID=53413 RepID=UPI0035574685